MEQDAQDRAVVVATQPTLKVRQIVSGPNHRTYYDPQKMAELEDGLLAVQGVMQPIQVRPHPSLEDVWEIVAGERRWRAAKKVFSEDYDMPVVVKEATDAEARALGIIENHHRDNPSDMEQAKGAGNLLQFCAGDKAETARKLGWSVETLERRLLLLACAPDVQAALTERRIKIGHAELLSGLPPERQSKVVRGVIEHRVPVEVFKRQLGQFAKRLSDAVFDTAQCAGCPHNSAQQSALFDESIGDGFCQHPNHFDELTLAALEAKAEPLREKYPVVRIVKVGEGFEPLLVQADGALGVGSEQYTDCKGCASFGCSISAVPGSYGLTQESLCFDAACHSRKVATNRKALRAAMGQTTGTTKAGATASSTAATTPVSSPKAEPQNGSSKLSAKVQTYRTTQWRRWTANALVSQPDRNPCVLTALALSGDLRVVDRDRFIEAARKLTQRKVQGYASMRFAEGLESADSFGDSALASMVGLVAAAAAYGIEPSELELLMNYLQVDEATNFVLDRTYLELLTVSELEAMAEETGLRKALGAGWQKARNGKRTEFIDALLACATFAYRGTVPKAMRYRRKAFKYAAPDHRESDGSGATDATAPDAVDAIAMVANEQANPVEAVPETALSTEPAPA